MAPLSPKGAPSSPFSKAPRAPGLRRGSDSDASHPSYAKRTHSSGLTFLPPERRLSTAREASFSRSLHQKTWSRSIWVRLPPRGPRFSSTGGEPLARVRAKHPEPPGGGLSKPFVLGRENRRGGGTPLLGFDRQSLPVTQATVIPALSALAAKPRASPRALQASVSGSMKWG